MSFCTLNFNYIRTSAVAAFLLMFVLTDAAAALRGVFGVQNCASVSKETCKIAHELKRGVNFGNMLEAPTEGAWGVRLESSYIDLIEGKFDTVRVPIRWSNHAAASADATIDEVFFKRVEGVVNDLLKKDVYVIINMHHYRQLFGSSLHPNEFAVAEDVVEARFLNMWRQISERFKDKSPKLLFELLNEPHGKINISRWNILSQKVLDVVRKANPTRTVLTGPLGNNPRYLPNLIMPKDENLIVAIHSYSPFFFTHQGITYLPMDMPTGVTCCDVEQRNEITTQLDGAIRWNNASGYPLHLGEFGSFVKADMNSRVEYTKFMRRALDGRGIGWTYWEFASNFGIYNPWKKEWRTPLSEVLTRVSRDSRALLRQSSRTLDGSTR